MEKEQKRFCLRLFGVNFFCLLCEELSMLRLFSRRLCTSNRFLSRVQFTALREFLEGDSGNYVNSFNSSFHFRFIDFSRFSSYFNPFPSYLRASIFNVSKATTLIPPCCDSVIESYEKLFVLSTTKEGFLMRVFEYFRLRFYGLFKSHSRHSFVVDKKGIGSDS